MKVEGICLYKENGQGVQRLFSVEGRTYGARTKTPNINVVVVVHGTDGNGTLGFRGLIVWLGLAFTEGQ